jgi:phenylacetic acid degradation operon negative regulatory protein
VTEVRDARYAAAPAGPAPPRQLIVTLYGLHARERDGWLSVAAVVRLLADVGVDAQAVRSSVSRLKRRGLLQARKVDGAAGYSLSAAAAGILAEGDTRIFDRPRATLADGWVLVVFSVPESEREKRHLLRVQLTRLGFGTVASGMWVAPAVLRDEAVAVLRRLELVAHADVFVAEHVAFGDLRAAVASWWDLDALEELHRAFLGRYSGLRERWANGAGADGRAAFADWLPLLTAWRRLPYADPGLPPDVLPDRWSGHEAAGLFAWARSELAGPAAAHARSVLDGG